MLVGPGDILRVGDQCADREDQAHTEVFLEVRVDLSVDFVTAARSGTPSPAPSPSFVAVASCRPRPPLQPSGG